MSDDLFEPLAPEQKELLSTVLLPFNIDGEWPIVQYVRQTLRPHGIKLTETLQSLPRVGIGSGYRAVWFDPSLGPETKIGLTVAAGLHVPEFQRARNFVDALRTLAKYAQAGTTPFGITNRRVSSHDLTRGPVGTFTPQFMAQFPSLMKHEPIAIFNHLKEESGVGDWSMVLNPAVTDFDDVSTVQDYIRRLIEVLGPMPSAASTSTPTPTPTGVLGTFVSVELIDELLTKGASTSWNVDKLSALLNELNRSHAEARVYASHALLRAILDHTPPIFGQSGFEQVANNIQVSRTDKKYLDQLSRFRASADDALHRHIRTTPDLLTIEDLPSRTAVNAFVRILVDRL